MPSEMATLAVEVAPVESVGLDGDALEAEAMAFIGIRSILGLPYTLPSTTGAPSPLTGGLAYRAHR